MDKDHASFMIFIVMAILITFFVFITNYPEAREASDVGEFKFNLPEFGTEETAGAISQERFATGKTKTKVEEEEEFSPEQDYLSGSRYLNKSHNFGLFKTKLVRIGWYKNPEKGYEKPVFRADIWVKNVGKKTERFRDEDAFIREVAEDKYNITDSSNFNGREINTGEEREGYLIFENVPYNLSGEVEFSIGTSKAYSTIFGQQMYSPHLYKLTLR